MTAGRRRGRSPPLPILDSASVIGAWRISPNLLRARRNDHPREREIRAMSRDFALPLWNGLSARADKLTVVARGVGDPRVMAVLDRLLATLRYAARSREWTVSCIHFGRCRGPRRARGACASAIYYVRSSNQVFDAWRRFSLYCVLAWATSSHCACLLYSPALIRGGSYAGR
jgi:hypothetical protein